MRVGFITQLLWPRYGPFWLRLVQGLEAEAVFAAEDKLQLAWRDPRLEAVPGLALRLAVAQALSLQHCDLLIAPDLNPGADVPRGGGQDPWIASFPDTLATSLAGLPPVVGVPAALEPDLEGRAIEVMTLLDRDVGKVRRVWERYRRAARSPHPPEPRWQRRPDERETVGLLAQPWLLTDSLQASLAEGRHLVSQQQLEPVRLREEGYRVDTRLVPTDAEVLGAARYLSRRGSVERLELLLDRSSGADLWLEQQVAKVVHKPLSSVYLQDLPPETLLSSLIVVP